MASQIPDILETWNEDNIEMYQSAQKENDGLLDENNIDGGSDLLKLANGFLSAFRDISQRVTFRVGLLYGVLSGITLALQLIAARILQDTMPTEQIIFSRSVGMFMMLSTVSWGESHRYDAKDMLLYNLYGITNVTGIYVAYIALSFTNVGNVNSVALNLTIPTAIMAYVLLRETVTRCMLGLFLVNVVGIILVSDPHGLFTSSQDDEALRDFYGVLLALFSMLAMTSSRIVARKTSLRDKIDTSLMTVMSGIVGVPTSLMLSLVRRITWTTPSMTYGLIWLLIYILSSIGANQFAMLGLKYESANNISILSTLSVPISYFASHIYFHENIKIFHLIGAFLILGSTAGSYFQM